MAQTKETQEKNGEAKVEGKSWLTALLLVSIAVAALAVLWAWAKIKNENEELGRELPTATIQIDVDQFDGPTRAKIVSLEKAIDDIGYFGLLGPCDVKYLLPADRAGDEPLVSSFSALTDAQWATAWRFAGMGEYLAPRVFRPDGKACVIRLEDKKGRPDFPSDAGSKLEAALEPFRTQFKQLRAYSRNAGVGGKAERDAINVTFGVQTAFVWAYDPPVPQRPGAPVPTWRNAEAVRILAGARPQLVAYPRIRSVTTSASLVKYFWAVAGSLDREPDVPGSEKEITQALDFARKNGMHPLMTPDGKKALIDVTTDTEGLANAELYYYMAVNLQETSKVKLTGHVPTIHAKLEGGIVPLDK
jgi:hypothetical protein